MKEQFIPYELAVKLKEIGFEENTLAEYDLNKELFFYNEMDGNTKTSCKAPLWQQAFDWFEEKHKLYSIIENVILDFGITDCRNNDIQIIKSISHESECKSKIEVAC